MSKRIVHRHYLVSFINQCYTEQEMNYNFCMIGSCHFCKKSRNAEEELCFKKFNSVNKKVMLWTISYLKSDLDVMCAKDIMVTVLLLQLMGPGKVGGGSFMFRFGWGDRRWASYFFYFLFWFCAVVNCSFMACT